MDTDPDVNYFRCNQEVVGQNFISNPLTTEYPLASRTNINS